MNWTFYTMSSSQHYIRKEKSIKERIRNAVEWSRDFSECARRRCIRWDANVYFCTHPTGWRSPSPGLVRNRAGPVRRSGSSRRHRSSWTDRNPRTILARRPCAPRPRTWRRPRPATRARPSTFAGTAATPDLDLMCGHVYWKPDHSNPSTVRLSFTCNPADGHVVPSQRLARETGHVGAQTEADYVHPVRVAVQRHHVHDQYGQLASNQLGVCGRQRVRRPGGSFFPIYENYVCVFLEKTIRIYYINIRWLGLKLSMFNVQFWLTIIFET